MSQNLGGEIIKIFKFKTMHAINTPLITYISLTIYKYFIRQKKTHPNWFALTRFS